MKWLKEVVRPVTMFALVAGAIYGFVVGLIGSEVYVPLVTLALVFYYKEREKKEQPKI